MAKANLHEAKSNLSKLVDLAIKGEEVIICKAGNPVVKLVPIEPKKKRARKAGAWAGKGKIKKDFDKLPEELMEYFS